MIAKKVCLLGPTGVGKTSLVKRFVEGIFSEKYLTTIGVKIDKKTVTIDDTEIQLMLWDMEGTDRYCGFQTRYLRGAAAYIIVVDQTRAQTLIEGMEIHKLVKEECDIPSLLVVNKSDLDASWHWTADELDHYKRHFNATAMTSAKTGENVETMFNDLASLAFGSTQE
ncbi:GTP-binding protein [Alteromonadaceae bacterium M269]|nr:GTP-binding protein [Alteromonadaceae bacterium M269]